MAVPAHERCDVADCTGARVSEGRCFFHAYDRDTRLYAFTEALTGPPEERVIDLRGNRVDRHLLGLVRDELGGKVIKDLRLTGAAVEGTFDLTGVELLGVLEATEVHFAQRVLLRDVKARTALFRGSRFDGPVSIGRYEVSETHSFAKATFNAPLEIGSAGEYTFRFGTKLDCKSAEFNGHAFFDDLQGAGQVNFRRAKFNDAASFDRMRVDGHAFFEGAHFAEFLSMVTTRVSGRRASPRRRVSPSRRRRACCAPWRTKGSIRRASRSRWCYASPGRSSSVWRCSRCGPG